MDICEIESEEVIAYRIEGLPWIVAIVYRARSDQCIICSHLRQPARQVPRIPLVEGIPKLPIGSSAISYAAKDAESWSDLAVFPEKRILDQSAAAPTRIKQQPLDILLKR